jgi:type II secretion system protein N
MANHKKLLGYLLFCAVVGALFMYFCFPSQAVSNYLEGSTARFAPDVHLKVERISPALPLGLELENASFSLKRRPHIPLLSLRNFEIMPSLGTLTAGKPVFRFYGGAYGGEMEGIVQFDSFLLKGPIRLDAKIKDVRLEEYPRLKEWFDGDLAGIMTGTMAYASAEGGFINGKGEGDFSVLNGTIQFTQPFLGLQFIPFERVDASMFLDNHILSLDRFDFRGEEIQGEVSGTISLEFPLAESVLDLRVVFDRFSPGAQPGGFFDVMRVMERSRGGRPFAIDVNGTVAEPRISFS